MELMLSDPLCAAPTAVRSPATATLPAKTNFLQPKQNQIQCDATIIYARSSGVSDEPITDERTMMGGGRCQQKRKRKVGCIAEGRKQIARPAHVAGPNPK
jgi:hypothetical protein